MQANTNQAYHQMRRDLATMLHGSGGILMTGRTAKSNHPLLADRRNTGFKLHLQMTNPDAPLCPFCFDIRTVNHSTGRGPFTPEMVKLAAQCMRCVQFQHGLACDAIVGVPRAGEPFAKMHARVANKHCLELAKSERGDQRKIVPPLKPFPEGVRTVVVVDGLVTGGNSKLQAAEALAGKGVEVTDVVVLIDLEQGGREKLAKRGINLHSVFTSTELFDLLMGLGRIPDRIYNKIGDYLTLQQGFLAKA
jgi:orotate phosphoribosyltransferase